MYTDKGKTTTNDIDNDNNTFTSNNKEIKSATVTFSTRKKNVFVIGKENKPMISLPKGRGVRISIK